MGRILLEPILRHQAALDQEAEVPMTPGSEPHRLHTMYLEMAVASQVRMTIAMIPSLLLRRVQDKDSTKNNQLRNRNNKSFVCARPI